VQVLPKRFSGKSGYRDVSKRGRLYRANIGFKVGPD
jgi:hypothetical protein